MTTAACPPVRPSIRLSSCPSVCPSVRPLCLFALPNYPPGTTKIDWTELCGRWMTDQLSVATVTQSHCMRTCRPLQPLVRLSLCLCLSVSVFLSHGAGQLSIVWVSLCSFSLLAPLMSTRLRLRCVSSSSAHPSVSLSFCLSLCLRDQFRGFVHIQFTNSRFFHSRDLNLLFYHRPSDRGAETERDRGTEREWFMRSQSLSSWMGILENSFPAYHWLIADLRLGGLENYIFTGGCASWKSLWTGKKRNDVSSSVVNELPQWCVAHSQGLGWRRRRRRWWLLILLLAGHETVIVVVVISVFTRFIAAVSQFQADINIFPVLL